MLKPIELEMNTITKMKRQDSDQRTRTTPRYRSTARYNQNLINVLRVQVKNLTRSFIAYEVFPYPIIRYSIKSTVKRLRISLKPYIVKALKRGSR